LIICYKEKNQLRVCCRIILAESEHNKVLVSGLIKKELMTKEFIKSQQLDADWILLKKEPVFYRMNEEDFEILISHYREIAALQHVLREPQISDGNTTITKMDDLPEPTLQRILSDCEKVCDILKKYSKSKIQENFQEETQ
jgi:hypothetical protein